MRRRRFTLPLALVVVGVLALVGCIPLPATQQFMTNGNLKPSWKIGHSKDRPVWLGHTTILDAVDFLSRHASGSQGKGLLTMTWNPSPEEIRQTWRKIDDHTFAMPYELRTAILIWPLCAMITPNSSTNVLILKTDAADRVIDYDVLSWQDYNDHLSPYAKPMFPATPQHRWPTTTTIQQP